jgi:hypothetical protein
MTAKESLSTLQMRDFAARLIAHENGPDNSSGSGKPAAFPVCEKLHPHLANLMGNTGFRALLMRAVARAEAELPSIHAMQVKDDGSLTLLDKRDGQPDPEDFAHGNVVVVAQLLGLLVAFIGEKLTLRIVCEVWPALPPNDLNLYLFERDPT